jgi:hypothetical protein
MKRDRITVVLAIAASLALASVGAQAASTGSSADVVTIVDGTAAGTVVMTGRLDLGGNQSLSPQRGVESVLQNEAGGRVRFIIAPSGELDLDNAIDLLDPRNLPDCGCLLIGDFAPLQDIAGSIRDHVVFHSSWMLYAPTFSADLDFLRRVGSPPASSVSVASWLLGDDGQPNS